MGGELEEILENLAAEATPESSGHFTIDPAKALEKFAGFQLSGAQWALKLVQAGVAAGSRGIDFSIRGQDGFWVFKAVPWLPLELEEAFWKPKIIPRESVEHLRIALWSIGFGQRKAFALDGPEWPHALEWDGREMRHSGSLAPPEVTLKILGISAARLELELAPRAYTCPVPLVVRGESLNKFGGEVLLSHSPEPGLLCRILRSHQTVRDSLHWVKDGVIVGICDLTSPSDREILTHFYLSGEVETDLTGLKLTQPGPDKVGELNLRLAQLVQPLLERQLERENERSEATAGLNPWEYALIFGAVLSISVPVFGLPLVAMGILNKGRSRSKLAASARWQQTASDYLWQARNRPWKMKPTTLRNFPAS